MNNLMQSHMASIESGPVKRAEDMDNVQIGQCVTIRGRKYIRESYGGTVAENYETYFFWNSTGKRVQIKLPRRALKS
jgi:hypothetical protein